MKPARECAGFIRVLSFRVRLCPLCRCVRRIGCAARSATDISHRALFRCAFRPTRFNMPYPPEKPFLLFFNVKKHPSPCARNSLISVRTLFCRKYAVFQPFPYLSDRQRFSCLRFPEQHLPACGKGFSGLRKRLFRCVIKALWRCCKARSAVRKSLFRVVTPPVSCRGRAVSGLQSVRGGTSDA